MVKVFSFLKLFEQEPLTDSNMTEIYEMEKNIRSVHASSETVAGAVTLTRMETFDESYHMEIAYRQSDHKTWFRFHPHGVTVPEYEWRTQEHPLNENEWDIAFTAPEFEVGLDSTRNYYSHTTLNIYPQLLAIVALITDDKAAFLSLLKGAMIDVENVYDVYLQSYGGNIDSGRLGQLVFINGQRNGKLMHAAKRVINALDNQKRDTEIHLLPHLGSLVPTASFEELTDILDFIETECRLTRYPRYTITLARVENITRILAHVKEGAEKRLKELMKEHTQTVTLQQLTTDETIREHIESGARVNLLLELNEMKWVD